MKAHRDGNTFALMKFSKLAFIIHYYGNIKHITQILKPRKSSFHILLCKKIIWDSCLKFRLHRATYRQSDLVGIG
jgi:hypothetical protein